MTDKRPVNRSSEELHMRELIVPELRKQYPGARIIHELPLRYSSNRIDLAAVTETLIVAVEIKSSRDVIDRLEKQLRSFFPVTHRLICALAPKWNVKLPLKEEPRRHGGTAYVQQCTPTQEIMNRVGIDHLNRWDVDASAGKIDAPTNSWRYADHVTWPYKMLHILHVSELEAICASNNIPSGRRPTHEYLVRCCHDSLRPPQINRVVCSALRSRQAFATGTDAPIFPSTEEVAA